MAVTRHPYQDGWPLQAAKPIRLNGVDYQPGERLSEATLSEIDSRRLRLLWEAKMVDVAPDSANKASANPKGAAQKPDKPQQPAPAMTPLRDGGMQAGEAAGVAGDGVQVGGEPLAGVRAGPFAAVHKGFGKFYVLNADGQTVSGPFKKVEATEIAEAYTAGTMEPPPPQEEAA